MNLRLDFHALEFFFFFSLLLFSLEAKWDSGALGAARQTRGERVSPCLDATLTFAIAIRRVLLFLLLQDLEKGGGARHWRFGTSGFSKRLNWWDCFREPKTENK